MVKILCFYLKKQPSYCTRYKRGNLLLCLSYFGEESGVKSKLLLLKDQSLDKNLPKDVRFPTNCYK